MTVRACAPFVGTRFQRVQDIPGTLETYRHIYAAESCTAIRSFYLSFKASNTAAAFP